MIKITRIILGDILKSKFVIIYTILLLLLGLTVFNLEDNFTKGLLSLLNIIVLTVPLVSIIFATSYLYNSSEFIELLLSQPIRRTTIWTSFFLALSSALSLSALIGIGIPILLYAYSAVGLTMICMSILISIVFISLAMFCTIITRDKAKGIGISIMLWLFYALLFDGIILFLLFQFSDYPIEKMMIGVSALNPLALSRILILLQLDVSAMMGYTGAIFKNFFGTSIGMAVSIFVMILWCILPFLYSLKKFKTNDL